jgi:hypothetical protein
VNGLEYKKEKVAYLKSNMVGVQFNESRRTADDQHLEFPPYQEDAM